MGTKSTAAIMLTLALSFAGSSAPLLRRVSSPIAGRMRNAFVPAFVRAAAR